MLNLSSSYLMQSGYSPFLSASPQVSPIMPVNLAPQPSLAYASAPISLSSVSQPLVNSLVQPVAQPLLQPISQPVVSPMVMPPQPVPQVISPPVLSSSIQGSLSAPISYERFIPPTPLPQSVATSVPVQAAPAYSTISAPAQNLSYSVGAPQFRTFSWM